MIYNDFKGLKVSALGFGAMRLPTIDGIDSKINPEATQQLVNEAMQQGINYYDTAWGYHGGKSQIALADCLRRYDRDKYFLANKFPGYDLSNMGKAKEIFEEQLKLCKVDYFDFYLIHNVCEMNVDAYLDPKFGIKDYFVEQVKNGRIKHLGFSVHGEMPTLKRFAEVYGDAMEFCQVQVNYLDWTFQHAKEKVEFCREHGWPVIVMEPLRGGKLANLPLKQENEMNQVAGSKKSTIEWAFEFLKTVPGILTTLTGMSQLPHAKQNIQVYETDRCLSEKEFNVAIEMGKKIAGDISIPCTTCRYCTSKCPKKLDIPTLISRYNEMRYNKDKMEFVTTMAMAALPKEEWPSACIACGACSKVCPQSIDIPKVMKDFTAELQSRAQ